MTTPIEPNNASELEVIPINTFRKPTKLNRINNRVKCSHVILRTTEIQKVERNTATNVTLPNEFGESAILKIEEKIQIKTPQLELYIR